MYRQGEIGDQFFVIFKGEVNVTKTGDDGEEIFLIKLGKFATIFPAKSYTRDYQESFYFYVYEYLLHCGNFPSLQQFKLCSVTLSRRLEAPSQLHAFTQLHISHTLTSTHSRKATSGSE